MQVTLNLTRLLTKEILMTEKASLVHQGNHIQTRLLFKLKEVQENGNPRQEIRFTALAVGSRLLNWSPDLLSSTENISEWKPKKVNNLSPTCLAHKIANGVTNRAEDILGWGVFYQGSSGSQGQYVFLQYNYAFFCRTGMNQLLSLRHTAQDNVAALPFVNPSWATH